MLPTSFQKMHINVSKAGVDCNWPHLYNLWDVTGVDERVQAMVASQEITAECLLAAMWNVEQYNYIEFSFVCHGATHRSVACCLLFTALAYRQASVHMTTRRTRSAADVLPRARYVPPCS